MLDMGFEKEVKGCIEAMRKLIPEQVAALSVVLAAATTGGRLTDLVQDLMKDYASVGFEAETETAVQVPATIEQLYCMVPSQYRIHVLLAFLFCKRASKVLSGLILGDAVHVDLSECELLL